MLRMPWKSKLLVILFMILSIGLMACSEEAPPQEPVVKPVKTMVIENLSGTNFREFPGRVDANRKAELSFRVGGTVNAIYVKEGDLVEQGQLLAELEKTDYQIAVNNQRAQYENAEKNFSRAKELIKTDTISRMDFDRTEANFKTAQANLEAAEQNLAYTRMTAPFTGALAKRHVENFEQVSANQSIFTLQEVGTLEVKVDVPERLLRTLRPAGSEEERIEERSKIEVVAFFDKNPQTTYPLTLKEVSTRADPNTQTFEVTYTMPSPQDITVLPGMTVSVRANLSGLTEKQDVVWVPAAAIGGSDTLNPQVWLVDESNMTLLARKVRLGKIEGNQIEVLEGLNDGDRLVVAGVGALAEGMPVRLMKVAEQAQPREIVPPGE